METKGIKLPNSKSVSEISTQKYILLYTIVSKISCDTVQLATLTYLPTATD